MTKRYGRTEAVGDFSLNVHSGEIHGLLGPNGSGKTTSLHIIMGLLRPDRGSVAVCGSSIATKKSRTYMGFAPDDLPLPGSLTGREYLDFHDAMRSRDDRAFAAQLLEALDLTDALEKQVSQYSHGMRRKIQVIAALSHRPALLVLDEPFRGLDPDASAVLRTMITSFAAGGGAVLIATHDMLRAERDCHHVTVLCSGITVAQGAPSRLIATSGTAENPEEVFLTVTGLHRDNLDRRDSVQTLFEHEFSWNGEPS